MRDDCPSYDGLPLAVLRRVITGQSDEAERRRVEAWAAETTSRRRYLAAMRELYEQAPIESRDEAAAQWARIAARLEVPIRAGAEVPAYVAPWEEPVVRVDVRRRAPRVLIGAFTPRRRWPAMLAAAAVLVIAVGGGTLVVRNRSHDGAPAATIGMRQIATAKGQRAEFQLDD